MWWAHSVMLTHSFQEPVLWPCATETPYLYHNSTMFHMWRVVCGKCALHSEFSMRMTEWTLPSGMTQCNQSPVATIMVTDHHHHGLPNVLRQFAGNLDFLRSIIFILIYNFADFSFFLFRCWWCDKWHALSQLNGFVGSFTHEFLGGGGEGLYMLIPNWEDWRSV